MKRLLLFIFISGKFVSAQSQWTQISFPSTNDIVALHFSDAQNGFLTLSDTLYKTSNTASTWQTTPFPINTFFLYPSINAMSWSDASHGFFCGDWGQCFYTTDGGQSIHQRSVPDSSATYTDMNRELYAISFPDNSNGWACGANGRIFHTNNGGLNWTAQSSGTTETLRAIQFIDSQNGFAAGHNKTLLKTTNGGNSWTVINIADPYFGIFKSMKMLSATHAFFADEVGNIAETTDGNTITKLTYQSGSSMFGINAIEVINAEQACVVGQMGKIAQTQNAGAEWANHTSGTTENLNAVSFVSATKGWAGVNNGVLLTFSGGNLSLQNISHSIQWSVFPNPCAEYIQIQSQEIGLQYSWKLFNMEGKALLFGKNASSESQMISLEDLKSGTYLLNIYTNGSEPVFRKTVIKNK